MKLDELIYEMNLLLTSKEDNIFREMGFKNNFSIYDFLTYFNNIYREFKRDYDALPQLGIAKHCFFFDYEKNGDFELLQFELLEPNFIDLYNVELSFVRQIDTFYHYLGLIKYPHGARYTRYTEEIMAKMLTKEVVIDTSLVKQYLEVFRKNYNYLKWYKLLRTGISFSDGINVIHLTIHGEATEINDFEIYLNRTLFREEDSINIRYSLGEKIRCFKGDRDKLILSSIEYPFQLSSLEYLVKNIYLNGFAKLENQENEKKLVKEGNKK